MLSPRSLLLHTCGLLTKFFIYIPNEKLQHASVQQCNLIHFAVLTVEGQDIGWMKKKGECVHVSVCIREGVGVGKV